MGNILLFGLGIPAIVAAIVQIAKALHMADDNTAPWWAFISGVVLSYLATWVTQFPQIIPFVEPLIYGIMIFAGSTGVYIGVKQILEHTGIIEKKSPDPAPLPAVLPPIPPTNRNPNL